MLLIEAFLNCNCDVIIPIIRTSLVENKSSSTRMFLGGTFSTNKGVFYSDRLGYTYSYDSHGFKNGDYVTEGWGKKSVKTEFNFRGYCSAINLIVSEFTTLLNVTLNVWQLTVNSSDNIMLQKQIDILNKLQFDKVLYLYFGSYTNPSDCDFNIVSSLNINKIIIALSGVQPDQYFDKLPKSLESIEGSFGYSQYRPNLLNVDGFPILESVNFKHTTPKICYFWRYAKIGKVSW